MASRQRRDEEDTRRGRPATTPEARENELVALAMDVAEKQMRRGEASSQVITHYLKLGSSREFLEQERIRHENELSKVKRESMASVQRQEEMYKEALDAMRSYAGQEPVPEDTYEE